MPEVLGALAQLVEGLGVGVLARHPQRAPAAAVDALEAWLEHGEAAVVGQRPAADAPPCGLKGALHLVDGGAVVGQRAAGRLGLGGQRAAQAREGAVVELVAVTRGEAVERLHEHRGVARPRQLAPGVAEDRVLAPVDLGAQGVAAHAHQRAQALERLARVVDRAVEVAACAGPVIEPVAGAVELPAGDAAHAVRGVLAAAQAVGPGPLGLLASVAGALDRDGGGAAGRGQGSRRGGGGCLPGARSHALWLPAGGPGQSALARPRGRLRRPARAASVRGWLRAPTDAGEAAPAGCSTPWSGARCWVPRAARCSATPSAVWGPRRGRSSAR